MVRSFGPKAVEMTDVCGAPCIIHQMCDNGDPVKRDTQKQGIYTNVSLSSHKWRVRGIPPQKQVGFPSSNGVCSDVTGGGLPMGDSLMTSSLRNMGSPNKTVLEMDITHYCYRYMLPNLRNTVCIWLNNVSGDFFRIHIAKGLFTFHENIWNMKTRGILCYFFHITGWCVKWLIYFDYPTFRRNKYQFLCIW